MFLDAVLMVGGVKRKVQSATDSTGLVQEIESKQYKLENEIAIECVFIDSFYQLRCQPRDVQIHPVMSTT